MGERGNLIKTIKEHMVTGTHIQDLLDAWSKCEDLQAEGLTERERMQISAYILKSTFDAAVNSSNSNSNTKTKTNSKWETHRDALKLCFSKRYAPGLISMYVTEINREYIEGKQAEADKETMSEFIFYVLSRFNALNELPGAEDAMLIVSGSEKGRKYIKEELVLMLAQKSSEEAREYFLEHWIDEFMMKENNRNMVYPKSWIDSMHRMIERYRKDGLEKGIERYGERIAVIYAMTEGVADGIAVECAEKVRDRTTAKRDILIEWIKKIRKIKEVKEIKEIKQIKTIQTIGWSNIITASRESIEKKLEAFIGNDILTLCEICNDMKIEYGTEKAKRVMLEIMSVTGSKQFLQTHPFSSVLDIRKEIDTRYDYYLSQVFYGKNSLKLSLNIVSLLLDYSYKGRTVGVALELARMLKKMEYVTREMRLCIVADSKYVQTKEIAVVLKKIVDKTYLQKKHLKKLADNLMYLLSCSNENLIVNVSSVLESIIIQYRRMDVGVKASLYGLPCPDNLPQLEKEQIKQTEKEEDDIDDMDNIDTSECTYSTAESIYSHLYNISDSRDNENAKENKIITDNYIEEISSKTNDKDNCLVLCSRIFEQMNKDEYTDILRISTLSLLCTMIDCTNDFLVSRIEKQILFPLLSYYGPEHLFVQNGETDLLCRFILYLSEYNLRPKTYFKVVKLSILLYENRLDTSSKIISTLFARNKYKFMYALSVITSKDTYIFSKCSKYVMNKIAAMSANNFNADV